MATGTIVINESRCKGCTLCTTACPKNIIHMAVGRVNEKGYTPAELVDPENACTGCAICAVICPDVCITVWRDVPASKLQTASV
ncbi:MAG: 4Fe-4S binding protein [Anaerolineae bacterium]|nr:4Fe-4S binding protein [Anaerolineae bacterium]